MTNIPRPTFGPTGFIIPTESNILAGAIQDINAAFGGGLNPALNTPQGQLASSETAIIGNVNDTFLHMTNQFNPAFAEGRWQDGLAYIYFITRSPSEPTVVQATCSGITGTVIPAGALAQAVDGNLYTCTQNGTIGPSGTVTLPFSCNLAGPIPCASGSLNTIYQSILGWDSVNNTNDGVIGQDVEGRKAFEERRFASVAKNSIGALPSVLGAVLSVPGVLDAYVTENPTAAPIVVGGYTLAAHSIYVAVVGGTAADVAQAIWTKKAPGCNYNGNTTVTVYDKNYDPPYPSYAVKFETPPTLPILFTVGLNANAQVPANAANLVKAALIAAFAGEDGGPRARIGSSIFASRFYAPVAALGPWVQIISIQIGSQNIPAAKRTAGSIAGATFTESGTLTGAFAVGQTLVGAGVLPGTTILSGASPTWAINTTQTVAPEVIYGVVAALNEVTVQIDQSPTLSADNIQVTIT